VLETASLCQRRGAEIACSLLDVCDRDALATWIRAVDDERPIDLAITSAGIAGARNFGRLLEDPDRARAVIATNLIGTINTLDPLVERMSMRGRGHLAVMGSLIGLRGLPHCAAYAASKAAIHNYAEALGAALAPHGIRVTTIAPGFVATRMTREIFCRKPLAVSEERAVRIIRRGIDRGARLIAFPRLLYWAIRLSRLVPSRWTDRAIALVDVDVFEPYEAGSG
jgi:NAD(P)-dependent dehydrogenase (short-subunit alcohol dehydrogenase family)